MSLVIDASAIGPVLIADEHGELMEGLVECLSAGGVSAPAHWPLEVSNLLLIAFRKRRLDREALANAFETLRSVRVNVVPCDVARACGIVASLAERHGLTSYDAAYLDLAKNQGHRLATADRALIRAARSEQVELFVQ